MLLSLKIYTVNGVLVVNKKSILQAGYNRVDFPNLSQNMHIYGLSFLGCEYFLRGYSSMRFSITANTQGIAKQGNLAKKAGIKVQTADIIEVKKEGQLVYRDSIWDLDTTGLDIKMIPCAGKIKDVDGNIYQTVKIGNQIWTVENFKSKHYNDATPIKYVTDELSWASLKEGAFCYHNDNFLTGEIFGAEYNWYAKFAPQGWHVPKKSEWDTLKQYLITYNFNYDFTNSENKIAKSIAAQTTWNSSPIKGFSGLCGCYREIGFVCGDGMTKWWSDTELSNNSENAYFYYIGKTGVGFGRFDSEKYSGYYVRLVKDI